ncbi:hypothetical protein XELAEV_18033042mg [Xenopus laevis]|uniref:Uncharacterized protein n=1 Tax=Xenopus laevis TaxID=8355 RepID=A0A974CIN4_XENLA|nr:hypothetical protein XELAEV_18033042mg [Xenopus laevis]
MPCCCGSIIRGHRLALIKIVAFSVDILSLDRPSLFHPATVTSSVSMAIGFKPSDIGITTFPASHLAEWKYKMYVSNRKETTHFCINLELELSVCSESKSLSLHPKKYCLQKRNSQ